MTIAPSLQSARRNAGALIQILSMLPTGILVAMSMGGPDASIGQLLQMFSSADSALIAGALIGTPVAGILIGHFVKRGHRTAYVLAAMAGLGTFFIAFPFSLLGLAVLYQLGRIAIHEFRRPPAEIVTPSESAQIQHASNSSPMMPNPSVEVRPNGMPSGPPAGHANSPPVEPGTTQSSLPHLKS